MYIYIIVQCFQFSIILTGATPHHKIEMNIYI